MKISLKYVPRLNMLQRQILDELAYHTTRLYNIVNYDLTKEGYLDYHKNYYKYKENYHTSFLHSHTYEYCLKVLDDNWKSYFGIIKDYNKNSSKYKGKPRSPKYKNDRTKNEIIFSNYAIRIKGKTLMLSLSKKMKELYQVEYLNFLISGKLKSLIEVGKVKQIKIRYNSITKEYEFIAVREVANITMGKEGDNILSIDVGLNNLVACVNLKNGNTMLVNGKPLKSINRYINNKISKLQSIHMKTTGNTNYQNTKRINMLKQKRDNYITTYMQKTVMQVLRYALANNCSKTVIGDISFIKYKMQYNKNFKEIPIQELVRMIEIKLTMFGIEVVKINESYTSGCSSIDLEKVSKEAYKKSRRIKRGLFKTNTGMIINADINGSLNILRKYIKDESIPKLIKEAMDKGYTRSPIKSLIS